MVLAVYLPIRALPDRHRRPPGIVPVIYSPVDLPPAEGPLRLVGAWDVNADDHRFRGISGLAFDHGQFLAVSDLGAVIRFDPPGSSRPVARLADLRDGPGRFGKKWVRDAESLTRDPLGHGWWVGYEQRHSLWLYDKHFGHALTSVDLTGFKWRSNRGAEGLLSHDGGLLALSENGKDAVSIRQGMPQKLKLHSNGEIAEAAKAPDGRSWVLLRGRSLRGLEQWIAPLERTHDGYRAGPRWKLPKGAFDNYEGMAIQALADDRWRFWLITDDGHRLMARTLLVAFDLDLPVRHDKSPARGAGLSMKPERRTPQAAAVTK